MNMYLSFMQRMLLIFAGFVCASNVSAYDFKVANGDGVTIYYDINGDDATVTSGDEKYTGDVKIPASVTYIDRDSKQCHGDWQLCFPLLRQISIGHHPRQC